MSSVRSSGLVGVVLIAALFAIVGASVTGVTRVSTFAYPDCLGYPQGVSQWSPNSTSTTGGCYTYESFGANPVFGFVSPQSACGGAGSSFSYGLYSDSACTSPNPSFIGGLTQNVGCVNQAFGGGSILMECLTQTQTIEPYVSGTYDCAGPGSPPQAPAAPVSPAPVMAPVAYQPTVTGTPDVILNNTAFCVPVYNGSVSYSNPSQYVMLPHECDSAATNIVVPIYNDAACTMLNKTRTFIVGTSGCMANPTNSAGYHLTVTCYGQYTAPTTPSNPPSSTTTPSTSAASTSAITYAVVLLSILVALVTNTLF